MAMRIWAICMPILLAGCGASSLSDLQSKPEAKYEFDVPMSYWATYARIGYAVHECFQSAGLAASWHVEEDLRSDLNRGDVTISLTNFGKRYYGEILIVPKDDLTAHATVWTARPDLEHLGPDAERWVKGDLVCGDTDRASP